MKLPLINEGIFEPHKSPVEKGKSSYIYILAFELVLMRVLKDFSVFLVNVNNLNLLSFMIITFSNYKIHRGVMKKIFYHKNITLIITPLGILCLTKM